MSKLHFTIAKVSRNLSWAVHAQKLGTFPIRLSYVEQHALADSLQIFDKLYNTIFMYMVHIWYY